MIGCCAAAKRTLHSTDSPGAAEFGEWEGLRLNGGALALDLGAEAGGEVGAVFAHRVEIDLGVDLQADPGAGDELAGRADAAEGARFLGQRGEAVPDVGADLLELADGIELQIHEDERQIAITQEKVGAAEGLVGSAAADPEESLADVDARRLRIEGAPSIDQRCMAIFADGLAENLVEHQSASRPGGFGHQLDHRAGGKSGFIEARDAGFVILHGHGSPLGTGMRPRKTFPKQLTKLDDFGVH